MQAQEASVWQCLQHQGRIPTSEGTELGGAGGASEQEISEDIP